MKEKLREYIDEIFADAPDSKRARDLKEEFYCNVCDRYDDLILDGKSESAAYNICIAGIGDVSGLIDEIRRAGGDYGYEAQAEDTPRHYTAEEAEAIEKYRARSGIMGAIGVALYILCWVPLVLLSGVSGTSGAESGETGAIIGLVIMMIMIAVATALMIIKSSIKPLCLKKNHSAVDEDEDDDDEERVKTEKQCKRQLNPALKIIKSLIWPLMLVWYFTVSFSSGAWHITWIIFLITTAVENIIEAIFELAGKKYL